jgi:hypothetical protein
MAKKIIKPKDKYKIVRIGDYLAKIQEMSPTDKHCEAIKQIYNTEKVIVPLVVKGENVFVCEN